MRRLGLGCLMLALTWASPVRGMTGLGVGAGLVGTDPCPTAFVILHGLLDVLLSSRTSGVLWVGVTPGEDGFLERHDCQSAFLGGGSQIELDDPAIERSTRRYANVLLVAFPEIGDEGMNVGVAAHIGLYHSAVFSSGIPGGYFMQVGGIVSERFTTISLHFGLFAGK